MLSISFSPHNLVASVFLCDKGYGERGSKCLKTRVGWVRQPGRSGHDSDVTKSPSVRHLGLPLGSASRRALRRNVVPLTTSVIVLACFAEVHSKDGSEPSLA